MENFQQQIINLLKEMAIAALEACVNFFKDLSSFRNRLITYVCLIGLLFLFSKNAQPGTQVAIISILSVCISYYFKLRNDSSRMDREKKDEDEK